MARRLIQRGVGRNSVVAVATGNIEYFAVAVLAILKAGAAYLAVDTRYPVDRVRDILTDAAPAIFKKLRVLQIDEWGGLPPGNPATCRTDLQNKLLQPLGISSQRFEGFRSDAPDPERECERISRWLAANGPIDICLLGLGLNGHVAMNEPADEFVPHPHVSKLTRSSIGHGMLKDLQAKPRYGLTLGLGDILRSRRILLVVSGQAKQTVMKRLLQPRVSTRFPASFLWLHSDVTIHCDRDAAAKSRRSL